MRGLRVLVAGAIIVAALGSGAARAGAPVRRLGSGANEVWLFWPRGPVKSVVVFGHGWSTPFPSSYSAWIGHLRGRGSIVVYPRFLLGFGDSTTSALAAFREGIVTAFRSIGSLRVPVVGMGKSFAGSAIFDYAAEARAWGVPAPAGVLSIFPAQPLSLPSQSVPPRTYVEILVGDADVIAGSAGAEAFWRWLGPHSSDRKSYVVVRSHPGFAATHDAPQGTDAGARAAFWRPLDALIARARSAG